MSAERTGERAPVGPRVEDGVVLAVDTATSVVNVAVGRGGEVLAEESVLTERRHAELITALIARVMDRAGVDFDALDAVIACVGPGLFTGLRVGVATARSIASVRSLPVVGVSSLEAMAVATEDAGPRIVATLDARRGEVAWACFEDGTRRTEDRIDPPGVVLDAIEMPVTVVGSGVDGLVAAGLAQDIPVRADAAPTPGAILDLGVRALARGEAFDVQQLVPNYLRRTDAEINHERRSA